MKRFLAITALVAVAAVALCAAVRFALSPSGGSRDNGTRREGGIAPDRDGNGDRGASGAKAADGKPAKGAKAKKKPPKIYFPVDELAPTSVVIRVNGAAITKADYTDWYRLRDRIFRYRHRIPVGEKNKKAAEFARDSRSRMCAELVRRELMRQYAAEKGVVLAPARVQKAETAFAKMIGRKDGKFPAVVAAFGAHYGPLLQAAVRADELDKACVEASATNDLTRVTTEEAEAQLARVKEANAKAEAKNAAQHEKALAARAEILAKAAAAKAAAADGANVGAAGVNGAANEAAGGAADEAARAIAGGALVESVGPVQEAGAAFGAAFAEVTARTADLAKDEGAEWDTLELGELQADDALAMWLMTAKPGDVSEPLDMEDGLAIVGLKRKYMGEAPDGIKPQMQFEVVRCTLYAYEQYEEPETLDELAKEMLAFRRQRATEDLGNRLMTAAKIDYPYGENIFRQAVRKPKNAAQKPAFPTPKAGPSTPGAAGAAKTPAETISEDAKGASQPRKATGGDTRGDPAK